MTRLLCTADLHCGAGQDHRVEALADQERILNQIAEAAQERVCDLVLLAGDVFHRPKPTPAELHVFDRFARQLAEAQIPCVAILGNAGHDQLGTDLPSALELFASPWLRVSRVPEIIKAAGDVAVCTLPSVPPGRLRAMLADRGMLGETSDIAAMLLTDVAAELRAQVPEGWPSVLVGHWSVSGASLPNGLPVAAMAEPVLPLEQLEALGFDAMVFGHIHRPQLFESSPFASKTPTFYTGSPMVMDFGEASFEHGVWILDLPEQGAYLNGDRAAPVFVPLGDRRFVTVNVDLAGEHAERLSEGLDETDIVVARIATETPLDDAVIRVTYRATEEQHRRVDHAALKTFLCNAGAHKVYGGIHWEPIRETRARVEGVNDTLAPAAALDLWLDAQNEDEPTRRGMHTLLDAYLEAVA